MTLNDAREGIYVSEYLSFFLFHRRTSLCVSVREHITVYGAKQNTPSTWFPCMTLITQLKHGHHTTTTKERKEKIKRKNKTRPREHHRTTKVLFVFSFVHLSTNCHILSIFSLFLNPLKKLQDSNSIKIWKGGGNIWIGRNEGHFFCFFLHSKFYHKQISIYLRYTTFGNSVDCILCKRI